MYFPNAAEKSEAFKRVEIATREILELPDKPISSYVAAALSLAENYTGFSWRGGKVEIDVDASSEQMKLPYGDPVGFKIMSNNAPVAHTLSGNMLCWDQYGCGCNIVKITYSVSSKQIGDDAVMGAARIAAFMFEHRGDTEANKDIVCASGANALLDNYKSFAYLS